MNKMQNNAFTIAETAEFFSVSTATIRNWVKTGYLSLIGKGKIDKQSVFEFKANKLGKEKLTSRANKSQKDSHNHQELTKFIIQEIESNNIAYLGKRYEESLSDSYRNKEGIYYTPEEIVNDLLNIKGDLSTKTFLDPCCGSGNFIMRAIELGVKPENIYGIDIDPLAVEITKKRIKEKTGYISENIICADFLEKYKENGLEEYDLIYTNPPWGKKIDKKDKEFYANLLNAGTSNDTCSLFFFASLSLLKKNGNLGLLLPEAFFNVAAFEAARQEMLKYDILNLTDYGKAFKGLQTGAVSFVLNKRKSNSDKDIICNYKGNIFNRSAKSFISNPKLIFNLNCDAQESKVIEYLFSLPYETLEHRAKWGVGIVTGNNAKFLKKQPFTDSIPVFKGSDITKEGLKSATNFLSNDFSQYQQVAPREIFEAEQKLIYKFISSNLCFYYDKDKYYVLNSANMIIVEKGFPVSMQVLSDLFNSSFMNWVFHKLFNTHKVLRGDLEQLPIYPQFIKDNLFNEIEYLSLLGLVKEKNGTFRIKK